MLYDAEFTGRKLNAIGSFYPIQTTIEADDPEAAWLALYERFEHIRGLILADHPDPKHTPGPWTLQTIEERHNDYNDWQTFAVRCSRNHCLAVVGEVDRYESERIPANARLIASAPDLIEACQTALVAIPIIAKHGPHYQTDILAQLRDAVAKATATVPVVP